MDIAGREAVEKYFWDADFKKINVRKHKRYVLERLLELGDEKAGKWLIKNFSKDDIISALKAGKNISPKSRKFWELVLSRQ